MSSVPRPVLVIAGTTIVIQLLMLATDMGPHLLLVGAVCALVGITIWVVLSLGRAAVRTETVSTPHQPPPTRVPDIRITLLRQGLSYGRHDNQIPERVYRSLVTLIDEELGVGHGIDRATDPESAHEIIGEDLTRFVDDPDGSRTLTIDGLNRIVTQIEQIRPEVPT